MVSILGDYSYTFPLPMPLTKRLKDILETDVDEKYYLSQKAKEYITNPKRMANNFTNINSDIAIPITAKGQNNWTGSFVADGKSKIVEDGDSIDIAYPNSTTRRGRHIKGMAHTITSENNSQVVVVDDTYKSREERKYDDVCPALRSARSGFKVQTEPCIAASRGRNPDNPNDRTAGIELEQRLEIKADGISNTLTTIQKDNLVVEPIIYDDYNARIPKEQNAIGTLTTNIGNSAKGNGIKIIEPDYSLANCRVRKLTPKECLRLMTFDDADYEKIKAAGISDSAIYKQAGNSIVVKVMMYIFAMMFDKSMLRRANNATD